MLRSASRAGRLRRMEQSDFILPSLAIGVRTPPEQDSTPRASVGARRDQYAVSLIESGDSARPVSAKGSCARTLQYGARSASITFLGLKALSISFRRGDLRADQGPPMCAFSRGPGFALRRREQREPRCIVIGAKDLGTVPPGFQGYARPFWHMVVQVMLFQRAARRLIRRALSREALVTFATHGPAGDLCRLLSGSRACRSSVAGNSSIPGENRPRSRRRKGRSGPPAAGADFPH